MADLPVARNRLTHYPSPSLPLPAMGGPLGRCSSDWHCCSQPLACSERSARPSRAAQWNAYAWGQPAVAFVHLVFDLRRIWVEAVHMDQVETPARRGIHVSCRSASQNPGGSRGQAARSDGLNTRLCVTGIAYARAGGAA